ncbi:hypothetical protein BSKO_03865 [Bryopsis sp. KO-2023]|nr:hypothetical protein BSKO_03865 [Bryopsis sp. KO-2023]
MLHRGVGACGYQAKWFLSACLGTGGLRFPPSLAASLIGTADSSRKNALLNPSWEQVRFVSYPRKKYEMSKGEKVLRKFEVYVVDRKLMKMRKRHYAEKAIKYHNNLNTDKMATIFKCCMEGRFIHFHMFTILSNRLVNDETYLQKSLTGNISTVLESVGVLSSIFRHRIVLRGDPLDEESRLFYSKCGITAKTLVDVILKREETNYKAPNREESVQIIRGLGHLYEKDKGLYINDEVKRLVGRLVSKFSRGKGLETCETRELAEVLFGCGNLKYVDVGSLEKICNEFQYRLETDIQARIRILSMRDQYDDWRAVLRERRPLFLDQMANVVWALGELNYCHLGVLDSLGDDIRARARFFREKELSRILLGMGKLGYNEITLMHAMVTEVGTPYRLKQLQHGELADLMQGMGHLKCEDDVAMNFLLYEVHKESERLQKMSSKELERVMDGLKACGRGGSDSKVMDSVRKALAKRKVKEQKLLDNLLALKAQRKKEYEESKRGPKKKKKKRKKMIRKKGSMW